MYPQRSEMYPQRPELYPERFLARLEQRKEMTAVPDGSLADKLQDWRVLAEGLKPRIEEVSFLREDHAELTALVQQIDALLTQADVHEGRLREANRQRGIAEQRTTELYGRMVFVLKGTYGKRANVLHELGLRPNAFPGPAKKEEEEETTPPAPGAVPPPQPPGPAPAPAQEEPTRKP